MEQVGSQDQRPCLCAAGAPLTSLGLHLVQCHRVAFGEFFSVFWVLCVTRRVDPQAPPTESCRVRQGQNQQ